MSEYYEMEDDNFCDYGVTKNPNLPMGTSFLAGRYIGEKLPDLILEVDFPAGYQIPHFFGNAIPVASRVLVDALYNAGVDNFQVFPVLLVNPDTGEKWQNYVALNVLGIVSAADLNRSKYDTLMEGNVEGIDMPVLAFHEVFLDKSQLHGEKMFRLAESRRTLIIHNTVVAQLKKHRPEGGWGLDVVEIDD